MTQAMERPGAEAPVVNPYSGAEGRPAGFFSSAIGMKWVMAVSGVALMGFVFAHMFGNLKLYLGRTAFDEYAESLRELLHPILPNTWLLWGMRIGLIVAFAAHIASAAALTRMNHQARPVRYQSPRHYIAANFASRTMRFTGIIILLFLVFHLADLTWGTANPDFVRGDAYDNLVASFERVPVAVIYVLANIALGIHLFHGGWSMFQSMGLNSPRYNGARRAFAAGFAVIVAGVNCSFPIAVQLGVVS